MTEEEKKRHAWLKKVVEMPHSEWMEFALKLKNNNPKALAEGAAARLRARGLIDIGYATGIRWIEPEWFERAKDCGALVWDPMNSQWIPSYRMEMDDEGIPHYHFEDYETWVREYKSWKAQQPRKRKLEYTEDTADYADEILNEREP